MTDEAVRATREVDAAAASIFAVLADPAAHAAIDGTGWVQRSTGDGAITAAGEVFRMAMLHPNHPDGTYRTANLVERFDPPRSIGWKTGYEDEDGTLRFGGWTWRYDLEPVEPSRTTVTLTYDWSATSEATRERIGFPPFPPNHLADSLDHLAQLVADRSR